MRKKENVLHASRLTISNRGEAAPQLLTSNSSLLTRYPSYFLIPNFSFSFGSAEDDCCEETKEERSRDAACCRCQTAREDAVHNGVEKLYTNLDEHEGDNDWSVAEPDLTDDFTEKAAQSGHSGSDYLVMYHFIEKLRGNKYAEIIDVYEALDMFLPALFAYRSVLEGKPQQIPDLRDRAERDKWRGDLACTDKAVAGAALQPSYSKGNPDIPPETYEFIRNYPRDKQITGRDRAVLGLSLPQTDADGRG